MILNTVNIFSYQYNMHQNIHPFSIIKSIFFHHSKGKKGDGEIILNILFPSFLHSIGIFYQVTYYVKVHGIR